MTPLCGALDIGSNSIKLLVGRPTGGAVDIVEDVVLVTRLSEGVDRTGELAPAAVERSLAAVRQLADRCRALGVTRTSAVGTAVLRDASNGADFLAACRAHGFEVEVVDGDTEAEIVRLAAGRELPGLSPNAVLVDIGGGSTELVWPGGRESTELGVVRLTERHVHHDPPGMMAHDTLARVVADRLAPLPIAGAAALVGSSASCSLLARVHLGLDHHDPERLHGHKLPTAALDGIASRLATLTQPERMALVQMDPRRGDVLLAGAMVLRGAAHAAGVDEVVVSDRGTRFGVFHRAFDRRAR